jgi:translation initiation factor 3 subunit C
MSSRFFHTGGSSDSSDYSSSDEYDSSDDEQQQNDQQQQQQKQSAFSRFLADEDSDEDSGKRVVKSAKQKLHEELLSIIKAIEGAKKQSDFVAVQNGT